jgi:hypothetical protein
MALWGRRVNINGLGFDEGETVHTEDYTFAQDAAAADLAQGSGVIGADKSNAFEATDLAVKFRCRVCVPSAVTPVLRQCPGHFCRGLHVSMQSGLYHQSKMRVLDAARDSLWRSKSW